MTETIQRMPVFHFQNGPDMPEQECSDFLDSILKDTTTHHGATAAQVPYCEDADLELSCASPTDVWEELHHHNSSGPVCTFFKPHQLDALDALVVDGFPPEEINISTRMFQDEEEDKHLAFFKMVSLVPTRSQDYNKKKPTKKRKSRKRKQTSSRRGPTKRMHKSNHAKNEHDVALQEEVPVSFQDYQDIAIRLEEAMKYSIASRKALLEWKFEKPNEKDETHVEEKKNDSIAQAGEKQDEKKQDDCDEEQVDVTKKEDFKVRQTSFLEAINTSTKSRRDVEGIIAFYIGEPHHQVVDGSGTELPSSAERTANGTQVSSDASNEKVKSDAKADPQGSSSFDDDAGNDKPKSNTETASTTQVSSVNDASNDDQAKSDTEAEILPKEQEEKDRRRMSNPLS